MTDRYILTATIAATPAPLVLWTCYRCGALVADPCRELHDGIHQQ